MDILACVGANGGIGIILDIGENGAETQRTYLTLETVKSWVQGPEWTDVKAGIKFRSLELLEYLGNMEL